MKPLIEIQTVPISIEYKVNPAQFKRADSSATVELSKGRSGGYRMASRQISLNVDTVEARKYAMPQTAQPVAAQPISDPPPVEGITPVGPTQIAASYSATAHFLANGNVQVDMKLSDEAVRQLSALRGGAAGSEAGASVPKTPAYDSPSPEQMFIPQDLSVVYELDKLSFDTSASMRNIEFEFVPGSIEFTVAEYPKVIIEYIGGPIYVPPSADPDYKPVDKTV